MRTTHTESTRCISQTHKIMSNIYHNCTSIIIPHTALNTLQAISTQYTLHHIHMYTQTYLSHNIHTYTQRERISYHFHLHLFTLTPLIPLVIKCWLDFPLGIGIQQHPFSQLPGLSLFALTQLVLGQLLSRPAAFCTESQFPIYHQPLDLMGSGMSCSIYRLTDNPQVCSSVSRRDARAGEGTYAFCVEP